MSDGGGPAGAGNGAAAPEDPARSAEVAGLRYVNDDEPGYTRRRCGKGWSYKDTRGETIRDDDERGRIEALAIPPAWTEVWICPDPDGHIQATGRDDAGRKQYRYHPRWREVRDATKFHRMIRFGRALPAVRSRVREDLATRSLSRRKVVAAVVRLLETTCLRVGNEEYRRKNGSFGLTTLRDRHVEIEGSRIRFAFEGKGGQEREVTLRDRRLARIVRACRDVPGQELFQFLDEDGERQRIGSGDVNEYLKDAAGEDFTAKDFRTWMGTLHAMRHLRGCGPPEDAEAAKKLCLKAIDQVAEALGNTRAVCRSFYIHPGLLRGFEEGWLGELMNGHGSADPAGEDAPAEGLGGDEVLLLELLEAIREHGEVGALAEVAADGAVAERSG